MSVSSIGTPSSPGVLPLGFSEKVRRTAIICLKELSFTLTSFICLRSFFIQPLNVLLFQEAVLIQAATSFLFHFLQISTKHPFFDWAAAWNLAYFTGMNIQTFIHECGHFFVSKLLFQKGSAIIQIEPFSGGMTEFYKLGRSPLYKIFGPSTATCMSVAAGPAFALISSSIALNLGLSLQKSYPKLSKYLIAFAHLDFIRHFFYALSAMNTASWQLSHDFVHLAVFGLSPMVAATSIAAIPVITHLAHFYCNKKGRENPALSNQIEQK